MKASSGVLSLLLAGALAAGAVGVAGLQAEERREYVPQDVERQVLLDGPLHGAEGKVVNIVRFTLPPGYVGGRHYHSGPVFVYVESGSLAMDVEGRKVETLHAGELYEEPIGSVMHARVESTTEPTTIVVFQVNDEGEPMMYQAD